MAKFSSIMLLTLVAVFGLLAVVNAGPDHDHHDHSKPCTCLNQTVTSPQLTTANTTCIAQMNSTSAEHRGKNMCFYACILKGVNVLTAADAISSTGLNTYIDAAYPQAARADLKTGMGACSIVALDTESKDEDKARCTRYKSMFKCLEEAKHKVCHPGMTKAVASEGGHVVQLLAASNSTTVVHNANHTHHHHDSDEDN